MTNVFIDGHAPLLWASLLPEFGRTVSYWPDGDEGAAQDLQVIWIEGSEDEEVSPGRYSHVLVKNDEAPAPPKLGDALEADGRVFDINRINAFAYGFSRCVLKERGGWLR